MESVSFTAEQVLMLIHARKTRLTTPRHRPLKNRLLLAVHPISYRKIRLDYFSFARLILRKRAAGLVERSRRCRIAPITMDFPVAGRTRCYIAIAVQHGKESDRTGSNRLLLEPATVRIGYRIAVASDPTDSRAAIAVRSWPFNCA